MKWNEVFTYLQDFFFKIVADIHRKDWRKMLDQAYLSSLLYVFNVNQFVSFLCNLIKMWPQWGIFFWRILYILQACHTVRKWIYIGHKLPRTFDYMISIYDTNAYKKCLEKLIWTKKKNHVPHRGIEPGSSLVRYGLARIKWKMSSALPTELLGHLFGCAQI